MAGATMMGFQSQGPYQTGYQSQGGATGMMGNTSYGNINNTSYGSVFGVPEETRGQRV